jgi:Cu/Ag efflux protein CusF
LGGEGVSYHSLDSVNLGGQYRTDGVGVESTSDAGGGYDVGFTAGGQWLKYTVNVTTTGVYTLQVRVASPGTGNSLHIEFDGVNISGSITVPNTGNWQTFQTVSVTTPILSSGQHIVRIYEETGGFNINWIAFAVIPAPIVSSAATASGTVGIAFNYSITASNTPTGFAANGLPAGLSVNTATGIISGTPSASGTFTSTVSATNLGGFGIKTVTITILPQAPVVSSAATAIGTVGSSFSYFITASNSPTGFAANGLPAGLSINTATGVINGTPIASGTFTSTVNAFNAGGQGTKTVTITILPQAPVVSSAATATGTVGSAFSYSITASNSPTGFAANGLPAGLSVNTSTGVINGTPSASGTFTSTVSAINLGGFGTKTVTITILPQAPVVSSVATATGTVGSAFSYSITASNTPISFAANGLPSGLSLNTATGVISGTPTAPGTFTSTVNAFNAGGQGSKTVTITILPQAPVVSSAATATGTVGSAFSYSITASNSPTSFAASGLPTGLSVNTATGIISGTPTAPGTFTSTVNAFNAGGQGSKTFTITILPQVPIVSSAATATGTIGSAFSYSITASNSPTSYAANGLPAGLSVNTATGVISGIPTASGTFTATISAINTGGTGRASVTFTIVTPVSIVSSPSSVSGTVGTAFSYTITGSNNPTGFAASGLPTGLTVNTTTGIISGIPTASGTFTTTVSAINAGGTGSTTVTFTIAPPSPVISSAANASGTVGIAFSYSITASNSPTSYAATGLPSGLSVNTATGVISGIPTSIGTSTSTVYATNLSGTGNKSVTITIVPPAPVVSSATTATGTVGSTFNYSITASNSPTSYAANGLPAGLSVNTATGVISGTPTASGTFTSTVSAINAGGTGSATVTFTIATPVTIVSSPSTTSGTVGTAFSYTITGSNNPTGFAASGLPAGLTVNTATGVISGIPTASGTFTATVSAINAGGTGSTSVTFTITNAIPPSPVVTSPATASDTVGKAFNYSIIASNSPASYGAIGLPVGMTLNTATGVIIGTPSASGTFTATVSAINAGGTGNETVTITIYDAIVTSLAEFSSINDAKINIYPNPFIDATTIEFGTAQDGNVKIVVYDQIGNEIETILDTKMSIGTYRYTFDASNSSNGIYLIKLNINDQVVTRKIVKVQ